MVGYWKWLKDKYLPTRESIEDAFPVLGYILSLLGSFMIPFFSILLSGYYWILACSLGLVSFAVYAFFSKTYIFYLLEKGKEESARIEVVKAALADPDTVLKIGLATDWPEIERILAEFARARGFKVEGFLRSELKETRKP